MNIYLSVQCTLKIFILHNTSASLFALSTVLSCRVQFALSTVLSCRVQFGYQIQAHHSSNLTVLSLILLFARLIFLQKGFLFILITISMPDLLSNGVKLFATLVLPPSWFRSVQGIQVGNRLCKQDSYLRGYSRMVQEAVTQCYSPTKHPPDRAHFSVPNAQTCLYNNSKCGQYIILIHIYSRQVE